MNYGKQLSQYSDQDFLDASEGVVSSTGDMDGMFDVVSSAPAIKSVLSSAGTKNYENEQVVWELNANTGRKRGESARVDRSKVSKKKYRFIETDKTAPVNPLQREKFRLGEQAVTECINKIKKEQSEVIELSDAEIEYTDRPKPVKTSVSGRAPKPPKLSVDTDIKVVGGSKVDRESAPATLATKPATQPAKKSFWKKLRNTVAGVATGIAAIFSVVGASNSKDSSAAVHEQSVTQVSKKTNNESSRKYLAMIGKANVSEDNAKVANYANAPTKTAEKNANVGCSDVKSALGGNSKLLEDLVKNGELNSNGTGIGKQLFAILMAGANASEMAKLKQLQKEVQEGSILDARNIKPNSPAELVALDTFRAFKSSLEKARNGKSIHITYKGESVPVSIDNPVIRRACEIRGIECEREMEPATGGYEYYPNYYVKNVKTDTVGRNKISADGVELAQIDAEWDRISDQVSARVARTLAMR